MFWVWLGIFVGTIAVAASVLVRQRRNRSSARAERMEPKLAELAEQLRRLDEDP